MKLRAIPIAALVIWCLVSVVFFLRLQRHIFKSDTEQEAGVNESILPSASSHLTIKRSQGEAGTTDKHEKPSVQNDANILNEHEQSSTQIAKKPLSAIEQAKPTSSPSPLLVRRIPSSHELPSLSIGNIEEHIKKTCFYDFFKRQHEVSHPPEPELLKLRTVPTDNKVLRPKKVYDAFIINDELDLVEMRLNELYPVVDYFVIVEAPRTLQNKPKPLHFNNVKHEARFARFASRIIHVVFEQAPETFHYWEVELMLRNAIGKEGLAKIPVGSPAAPESDDIIVIGDVDEFVQADLLLLLKHFDISPRYQVFSLQFRWTYYNMQWHNAGPQFLCSMTTFRELKNNDFEANRLRYDCFKNSPTKLTIGASPVQGAKNYYDQCWPAFHCSWCFPTINHFVSKIESFAHVEFRQEMKEYKDVSLVQQLVKEGKWLLTKTVTGTFVSKEQLLETKYALPRVVRENPKKYFFMLNEEKPIIGDLSTAKATL